MKKEVALAYSKVIETADPVIISAEFKAGLIRCDLRPRRSAG